MTDRKNENPVAPKDVGPRDEPFQLIQGPLAYRPMVPFKALLGKSASRRAISKDQVKVEKMPDESLVGRKAPQGCMKCLGPKNPDVLGDLLRRQKRVPRVQPTCDGNLRGRFLLNFYWKNEIGAQFSGDNYNKQPDDASVFCEQEQFDELVDLVTFAVGLATTLPQNITATGISKVDDRIRELVARFTEVFDGKNDVDRLLSVVTFEFDTPLGTELTVRHALEYEIFAKDSGTCEFQIKIDIDGTEHAGLKIDDKGPATSAPPSPSTTPTPNTPPSVYEFGPGIRDPKTETFPVLPGSHTMSVRFELKAGHSGIADENLKRQLEAAIQAAQDAMISLIRAATSAFNALSQGQPIPPDVTNALRNTAGSILETALNALMALLALLRNLSLKSRAFVKLHNTTIQLTCLATENGNQQPSE